ncbi:MAG: cytochrome c [Cyanobacteriota/Melainabacteria group bacterium]
MPRHNLNLLYLALAAGSISLLAGLAPGAFGDETGAKDAEASKRLITPLDKIDRPQKPEFRQEESTEPQTSSDDEDDFLELPPWGYVPREEDEASRKGKELYEKHNCKECHAIFGKGGEVGPPLDGIGGHRGPEWLMDRMLNPKDQMKKFAHVFGNRPNIMPHPALTKQEAEYIVDYILTLPEPKEGYLVASHSTTLKEKRKKFGKPDKPEEVNVEGAVRGAKLFYEMSCYTCHSTDGSKDRFGPDLAGISTRAGGKELKRFLKRTSRSPLMREQEEKLTDEQLEDLKEFLMSIPEAPLK